MSAQDDEGAKRVLGDKLCSVWVNTSLQCGAGLLLFQGSTRQRLTMSWCENTDPPRAATSAGARWLSAAGLRLFIPAESLPVEPSCLFFYVNHPRLHWKTEMQDSFSFPGTTLLVEALEKGRGCCWGSGRSQPCCCRCWVRCFIDWPCKGSEDGDFVAEPVAQRPQSSVAQGWGCHKGRKPSSGSCGAAKVKLVLQRVYILPHSGRGVVGWSSSCCWPWAVLVLPPSCPAGAAQHGSLSTRLCRWGWGCAQGSPQRTNRLVHELCECDNPVPHQRGYPHLFSSPCFSIWPFVGKKH